MRQLRTCDFCGDEAVGTFEIVPPELNPTEAEQRRVVLCAGCQPTLEELLEPLLSRAGADGPTGTTDARSGLGEGPDDDTRNDADTQADGRATTTDQSGAASNDGNGSGTPGLDPADDDAESVVPDAVVTPDADDAPAPEPDTGVTIGGEPAERNRDAEGDSGASGTDAPEAATDTPGAPPAYGKVIRLLQNREFPMARSEVEALAGSAYDLEDHEVTAIINHAVKQGEFELEGRQIRQP